MGWERKEIQIYGHVSRHNSRSDDRDDGLWADLVRRVNEIVNDPQYEPLTILVNGDSE